MPKYVALFKAKGETIASLMERPSDRAAAVRKLVEAAGGKVETYYWMFGQYDGFALLDVPDSKTAASIVLSIASTGAFTIETHEAIAPAELGEILARAKDLRGHYQAPGR
jgi:uncharacterized protein with GYD domain